MDKEKIEALTPDRVLKKLADRIVPAEYKKETLITMITAVVTAFLSYFMLMVDGLSGPDAIVEGVYLYNDFDWAISLGRWFIAYTERYAVNNAVLPFLIVIMYAVLVGISAAVVFRMMKIKSTVSQILVTGIFVSFPIVSLQFGYLYMAVYYAYSFFCAVIGIQLIRQRKLWGYVLALVCFVTMMGSYQSYLCAVAALAVMMAIIDLMDGRKKKDTFIDFGVTAGIGILSAIADLLIIRFTFWREGIEASARVNDFSLSEIFGNLGFSFKYAFVWFFTYFWGDEVFSRNLLYAVVLLITAAAFVLCVIKLVCDKKYLNAILVCIGLYLIPHCMNIIQYLLPHNGVVYIMRYQYVLLFAFTVAVVGRCEFALPKCLMQWVVYLVLFSLLSTNILSANITRITYRVIYNEVYTEASAMVQRVYEVEGYVKDETKVILAAPISAGTAVREFGMFYEEADIGGGPVFWPGFLGLNVNRRHYFINYLGVDFGIITEEDYNAAITSDAYKEMPSWPETGSVKMINGCVVIKNDR